MTVCCHSATASRDCFSGEGILVCHSSQVSAFLDQVNADMACRTPGCSGVYVPVRVVLGAGWGIEGITCNGCKISSNYF